MILPNGKIIWYNDDWYQNNMLKLVTEDKLESLEYDIEHTRPIYYSKTGNILPNTNGTIRSAYLNSTPFIMVSMNVNIDGEYGKTASTYFNDITMTQSDSNSDFFAIFMKGGFGLSVINGSSSASIKSTDTTNIEITYKNQLNVVGTYKLSMVYFVYMLSNS